MYLFRGQQNIGFLVTEDCAPSMSNGMQSSNEEGKESLDQPSDFVSVGDKCTSRFEIHFNSGHHSWAV